MTLSTVITLQILVYLLETFCKNAEISNNSLSALEIDGANCRQYYKALCVFRDVIALF